MGLVTECGCSSAHEAPPRATWGPQTVPVPTLQPGQCFELRWREEPDLSGYPDALEVASGTRGTQSPEPLVPEGHTARVPATLTCPYSDEQAEGKGSGLEGRGPQGQGPLQPRATLPQSILPTQVELHLRR